MEELNETLQKFLKSCEESFADRYTDTDAEYTKHCEEAKIEVPIEERWFVRPSRSHHYDNRDRDRERHGRWEHRGGGGGGGYNNRHDNRDHHGRRDNYGRQRRDHYNNRNHPYSRQY